MNAKQRYRAKRASEHRERKAAERRISRKIGALCGCSERVTKALIDVPRITGDDSADNVCLPNVFIYQAGHRNNRKDATHIIK